MKRFEKDQLRVKREQFKARRLIEKESRKDSRPFEDYATEMEYQTQLLTFHPNAALALNLFFTVIGGSPLLAANSIKQILFELGSMEWETSLLRNFCFNSALAFGMGLNLLMYVPSITLTDWLGPSWTTTLGFTICSVAYLQLGRCFHSLAAWLCISSIGIGTAIIYNSLSIHTHAFRESRNEVLALSFYTFAESCSIVIPIFLQLAIEMTRGHISDIHPSLVYQVAFVMLSCGLFCSFYLSSFTLNGASRRNETVLRQRLAHGHAPHWSTFFCARQERLKIISDAALFSTESETRATMGAGKTVQNSADLVDFDINEDIQHNEEREELLPGDLRGSLLHSANLDERDLQIRKEKALTDDPVHWKLPLKHKIFTPQFIVIGLCLGWMQFIVRRFEGMVSLFGVCYLKLPHGVASSH